MTKEELNKKIKKLKKDKLLLLKEREYCSKNGNIYYSITNIMKINMMLDRVDDELKNYDFYNFDEEFISYILYMINEIENYDVLDEDYIKEEYRFVEISNEGLINTYNKKTDDVISVIAKNKNVKSLKMKYFGDLYFNESTGYNILVNDLVNNADGFVINVRKDNQDLVINSSMFNSNFVYVSEFLDKISNCRLMNGKNEIDINTITTIMNDIIIKYRNINKVLRKH